MVASASIQRAYYSLAEERGSSLVAVLVVLTTTTLLFGSVALVLTAQHRLIRRDAHRLQAAYAAEAGVVAAVDRLSRDPAWRPEGEEGAFPGGFAGEVSVTPHGGFFWVAATARAGGETATARALVGAVPDSAFQAAVVLDDPSSGLVVAGATRIRGDLWVGEGGARTDVVDGRPFSGTVQGDVHALPDPPPVLRYPVYEASLDEADYLLATSDVVLPGSPPLRLVRSPGDLALSTADSVLLHEPVLAVAAGDLSLDGPLSFAPGSRFIAGGRLSIRGEVEGIGGLFIGGEEVVVADFALAAGQFLARRRITVGRAAFLTYPSVLYAQGVTEEGRREGGITLRPNAHVSGTVVLPEPDPEPEADESKVFIPHGATVRGAVVCAGSLELFGRVEGSVLTRRFSADIGPTAYTNWLVDAVVDVPARPAPFLIPLADGPPSRLGVLLWTAETD